MNEHYYSAEPTSRHDVREFTAEILGLRLTFSTDAGTFSRDGVDPGTRLLIETMGEARGRFLDLACGWGPVGVAVGKKWPGTRVVMTDVNRRAAELARENAARNGVAAEVVSGDGFEAVEGYFDAIAVNPPIRAGKQVVYALFRQSLERLTPGGTLWAVVRKQQGAESALKFLREISPGTEVAKRGGGYWILRAPAPVDKGAGEAGQ